MLNSKRKNRTSLTRKTNSLLLWMEAQLCALEIGLERKVRIIMRPKVNSSQRIATNKRGDGYE